MIIIIILMKQLLLLLFNAYIYIYIVFVLVIIIIIMEDLARLQAAERELQQSGFGPLLARIPGRGDWLRLATPYYY